MFTTYVTRVRSMTVLCTLIGERPPAILGDVRCVCTFSDSPGDVAIVVDYHVCGGSGFDRFFFTTCPWVIAFTAFKTAK